MPRAQPVALRFALTAHAQAYATHDTERESLAAIGALATCVETAAADQSLREALRRERPLEIVATLAAAAGGERDGRVRARLWHLAGMLVSFASLRFPLTYCFFFFQLK